jgi:hypothetical protein
LLPAFKELNLGGVYFYNRTYHLRREQKTPLP